LAVAVALFSAVAGRRMCNCGRGRRGAVAAAGGGGCVGPGCGVRAAPTPSVVSLTRSVVVSAPRTPVPRSAPQPVVVPVAPTELAIVDPALWGPHLWRFLHIASERSVVADTRKWAWDALFAAMQTGLPCPECTEHYNTWVATMPFDVTGASGLRDSVRGWVQGLHNAVNLRREVPVWTPEEVTAAYAGLGFAEARAALAAAGAAGVGSWVIAAGEQVIRRAMM
jgi:hypothetical protein